MINAKLINEIINEYGNDILSSRGMQSEKGFVQHGRVSCFAHSVRVARVSLRLASALKIPVDVKSLVRGALLHDYFLYDWHIPDERHRLHGFSHALTALKNAGRDFYLTDIETDIIRKHMFPLNLTPPKYRESLIVCIADKICALCELRPFGFILRAGARQ